MIWDQTRVQSNASQSSDNCEKAKPMVFVMLKVVEEILYLNRHSWENQAPASRQKQKEMWSTLVQVFLNQQSPYQLVQLHALPLVHQPHTMLHNKMQDHLPGPRVMRCVRRSQTPVLHLWLSIDTWISKVVLRCLAMSQWNERGSGGKWTDPSAGNVKICLSGTRL